MTVLQLEKRILDYLTTNGAASKFEIQTAIGCSKAGVQSAVKSLLAKGSVEPAKSLRKHNSPRRHAVFNVVVAKPIAPVFKQPAVESVNVFEHPEIYSRLHELETQMGRLSKTHKDLRADFDDKVAGITNELAERSTLIQKVQSALKILGKRTADLDLDRIRIDGVLIEQCDRIRALEPQPAVDPLYTVIERDITDKLGGQISPELLRATIDNAYAERKK
jgi:hypothetical protein